MKWGILCMVIRLSLKMRIDRMIKIFTFLICLISFRAFSCQDHLAPKSTMRSPTEALIINYTEAITRLMNHNLHLRWHSSEGGCYLYSYGLLRALSLFGFHLKRILVADENGAEHAFLIDEASGKEIIIDPTYLQFFKKGEVSHLPPIFVGTPYELIRLFAANGNLIRGRPPNIVQYANEIYGLRKYSSKRRIANGAGILIDTDAMDRIREMASAA